MDFEGQREGEEVVLVFRRHILTTAKGLLIAILLMVGGAIPMMVNRNDAQLFWLWVGCLVLGVLGYLYSYMLWYFSYYIVTTERLRQVRQKGLFKRTMVDLELENMQSISYGVMGALGSMFDYGTILIQTAVGDLTLSMVSHPESVYNEIQNAKHGGVTRYDEEDEEDYE